MRDRGRRTAILKGFTHIRLLLNVLTMRRLVTVILAAILVCACTDTRRQATLDRAARLMDTRPDSSLLLLDSLLPAHQRSSSADRLSDWPRRDRTRWLLLRTNAENKLDTVFRTDTLFRPVVDWYDLHGTPNERMLAHYLLGRIYSDMGDAPAALQAFHDAADCADTIATDCDYRQLMILHGQMAELYALQLMPKHQIAMEKEAFRYALLTHDTLTALFYEASQASAYELLHEEDSVEAIIRRTWRRYADMGQADIGSQFLGSLIFIELSKGKDDDARRHLAAYERAFGITPDGIGVEQGREMYYYMKGVYYSHVGKTDSASHFFHREIAEAKDLDNIHAGYNGLQELYRRNGLIDSVAKYAVLSHDYNDSVFIHNYSAKLQQLQSLYDYRRHQEAAMKLRLEKKRAENRNLIFACVALVAILLSYIYIARQKKRKEKEQLAMELQHQAELNEQARIQEDLQLLLEQTEGHFHELVNEKNRQLCELEERIRRFNESNRRQEKGSLDSRLENSSVYETFRRIADKPLSVPTREEWKNLRILFNNEYPAFYSRLVSDARLGQRDYRICMLIRLGFKPTEISNLIGSDLSTVSHVRLRLYKKLIGNDGSAKDFDQYLHEIM